MMRESSQDQGALDTSSADRRSRESAQLLKPQSSGALNALECETINAILRTTLDPIVTTDSRGVILTSSDSIQRVLGWKSQELIGRNISVLIPPPHDERHDEYIREYHRTGVSNILGQTRELMARHQDGRRIPIELSVSRTETSEGREPIFVGIIHDITLRIESELEIQNYREHLESLVAERTVALEGTHAQLRMADRLASIGTLAAGLGHDMYNLLLPIRCRLDLLDAEGLSEKAKGHLEAVRHSVNYLQQLADGLHLLALDPNDPEASSKTTDLTEWWEQMGVLLVRGLPKNVQLSSEIASGLPPLAVAPHRLMQSVLNLIVNAGEAVREDGQIWLALERADEEGMVSLTVRDNGSGMTPEVMKNALDPFFTTKKRGLGTGLGLSLVHGMIRSIGGSVKLDSEPGLGTTVTLLLPVAESPYGLMDSEEAGELPRAVVTIKDARIASIVSTILEPTGFRTLKEACGEDVSRCELRIMEAKETTIAEIERLTRESCQEIIILGEVSEQWKQTGARIVCEPDNFELLRKTIGEAIDAIKGDSP